MCAQGKAAVGGCEALRDNAPVRRPVKQSVSKWHCVRALAAALLALLAAGCGSGEAARGAAAANVVNVYNWSDYVAPDTLERFTAETGIRVNYDVYDTTYIVDTRLLAGGSGYDVVVHAGQNAARLIPVGVFQPLDASRLDHWQDQDQRVLSLAGRYPGTREHSVVYMWGTTGVAYNAELVRERLPSAPVDSAAMLFDPAVVSRLADCGVTLLDEVNEVVPLVLAYLGRDPDSFSAEDLRAVEDTLMAVRPYLRYFSSTKLLNDLPNRDVCVAMSWSGDFAQAAARVEEAGVAMDLRYTIPAEGSRLWFDGLYIPADAPNADNAHRLIDFLMRPDVIADVSNYVYYANGMASAIPLIDPQVVADPTIYPTEDVYRRLFVPRVLSPAQERDRNRLWARVKSGI